MPFLLLLLLFVVFVVVVVDECLARAGMEDNDVGDLAIALRSEI